MKYRIKTTTYGNGRKDYRAQVKRFWGWYDISYEGEEINGVDMTCNTRERALDRIDLNYEGNTKEQTIEFEYINK